MLYPYIQPITERIYRLGSKTFYTYKIQPLHLHIAMAVLLVLTFLSISGGGYAAAMLAMLASRALHGSTNTLLKAYKSKNRAVSSYDLFLLQAFDYLFYGGFVFFFMIGDSSTVIPGAFLMLGIYLNAAIDLSYKTVTTSKDRENDQNNVALSKFFKPLYGLAQGTETIIAFTLMCLIPSAFPFFAVIYGFICFASAIGRVLETRFIFAAMPDIDTVPETEKDIEEKQDSLESQP